MVIVPDRLSALSDKGEVTERDYNPATSSARSTSCSSTTTPPTRR